MPIDLEFDDQLRNKIVAIIVQHLKNNKTIPAREVYEKLKKSDFNFNWPENQFCAKLGLEIKSNSLFKAFYGKLGRGGGIAYKTNEVVTTVVKKDLIDTAPIQEVFSEDFLNDMIEDSTFSNPEDAQIVDSFIKDGYQSEILVSEQLRRQDLSTFTAADKQVDLVTPVEISVPLSKLEVLEDQKTKAVAYYQKAQYKHLPPQTHIITINNLPWKHHVDPWNLVDYLSNVLELVNSSVDYFDSANIISIGKVNYYCSNSVLPLVIKFIFFHLEGYVEGFVSDMYYKKKNDSNFFISLSDQHIMMQYQKQFVDIIGEGRKLTKQQFQDQASDFNYQKFEKDVGQSVLSGSKNENNK